MDRRSKGRGRDLQGTRFPARPGQEERAPRHQRPGSSAVPTRTPRHPQVHRTPACSQAPPSRAPVRRATVPRRSAADERSCCRHRLHRPQGRQRGPSLLRSAPVSMASGRAAYTVVSSTFRGCGIPHRRLVQIGGDAHLTASRQIDPTASGRHSSTRAPDSVTTTSPSRNASPSCNAAACRRRCRQPRSSTRAAVRRSWFQPCRVLSGDGTIARGEIATQTHRAVIPASMAGHHTPIGRVDRPRTASHRTRHERAQVTSIAYGRRIDHRRQVGLPGTLG